MHTFWAGVHSICGYPLKWMLVVQPGRGLSLALCSALVFTAAWLFERGPHTPKQISLLKTWHSHAKIWKTIGRPSLGKKRGGGSLQQCGQAWYARRRTRMWVPLPKMQLFVIWRESDLWACRVDARPLRCHVLWFACYAYEWVMSHLCIGHITHEP